MASQLTLVDKLQQRARKQGPNAAFIFRTQDHGRYVLSWSSLHTLGGRFASMLHSKGLGRGDRVVNTLVNSPERVLCEVGLWMAGATSVNGHCQMADGSDLLNTARVSRASGILVDPDVTNSPWHVLKNNITLGKDGNVASSALKDLKHVFFIRRDAGGGANDFITRMENQKSWFQAGDILPEDTLTVFTTSGSTGFSKLVPYSHSSYLQPFEDFSTEESDSGENAEVRNFNVAPLGWTGGFTGSTVAYNQTRVLCDVRAGDIPKDMPGFIRKVMQEEQCTVAVIAPVFLPGLAQLAKENEMKSELGDDEKRTNKLDLLILGGQPVSRKMIEAALSMSHSVLVAYGGTDFSFITANVVTESETFVDNDTGSPVPDIAVKIVSEDNEDNVLPVNQVGKILAKGPLTKSLRYLGDVKPSDYLTHDGFFRTGDIGRLDERGHLIVSGRGSDAIMRGPYIFYPSWIESRIKDCPGVRDVIVVGVPDPFLNEELCACVILDSGVTTLDGLRQLVEKDVLTSEDDPLSPRPRYYLEFESFPETDSGKPRRNVVKAQAASRIKGSSTL